MFWLTVRQHRMQLVVTVALLAVFGVVLLVHGIGTTNAVAGLSGDDLEQVVQERYQLLGQVVGWLPVAPVLVGLFWGAPVLAREVERGTLVLVWTQSVPRHRWLLAKLAWLGLLVTLAGLALGVMMSAWLTTFEGTRHANRFGSADMFGVTGVAGGAWWLFGFVLGVAGGAVLRRMLPAMAVTIALFIVVMFGVFTNRESYATPERVVPTEDTPAGDVLLADAAWLDPSGKEVAGVPASLCSDRETYLDCAREAGYRTVSYVHPAGQYWRFQWTEAGILLFGTVLLAGVAYRRVARRSV